MAYLAIRFTIKVTKIAKWEQDDATCHTHTQNQMLGLWDFLEYEKDQCDFDSSKLMRSNCEIINDGNKVIKKKM